MKKTFTLLFTLLIFAQMWAATGSWDSGSAHVALADDGTITITGTTMADYAVDKLPEWNAFSAEIKKVVASVSVVHIGKFAFYNCANLETVELTNDLSSIGDAAFMYCGNLKSITLPENENFKYIKASTFFGSGLTGITIPASVTNIYNSAFGSCTALQYIRCKGTTPPTANASSFNSVPRSIPLYVPFQSLDAYQAAAVWSEFNVLPDPEQCPAWGNCGLQGDNVTWSLDCEGVLIISGTGAMANYAAGTTPWYAQRAKIKTAIIAEGVTTVGSYAIYNCKNITSLTLPNSLVNIGNNAFNICMNITSIVVPSSVATIGSYAFASCIQLASVRLLGNTSIDNGAFKDCSALTSILCGSQIPPTCATNAFMNLSDEKLATILLSVPGLAISAYKAHEIWSKFNIQASNQKKIQFVDEAGQVMKTEMLDEGTMPNADELTPTKAEDEDYTYEFAGWLPALHEVEEDYVYVTQFVRTPKKFFHVTIGGENCSLEVLNKVPEGTFLEVKVNPNECLQFQKWSDDNTDNPRIIEVTGDMNVSAELNKITYTVTDNSQNGHLNIAPQQ